MSSLSLFEGNCNECPLQGKNPFIGKDGLYNLVYAAYRQYSDEVMVKGKLYRRYVEDFLNGHAHSICPCYRGKNEYEKNLGIVKGILQSCPNIVKDFWRKGHFGKEDFTAMQQVYETTDKPIPYEPETRIFRNDSHHPTLECYLTTEQMSLIAQCVNEAHLFSDEVSTDDIKALLHCKEGFHLYAKRLNQIAKLFDRLSFHHLICHNWQSVLSENRLLRSSRTGLPVSRSNLSSALSQLNKRDDATADHIEQIVKEVKAMGQTDRNTNI